MSLSEGLVSQFAKIINDRGPNNNDFTVYGTIVEDGSRNYVRLDGSDISTPIETTVEVSPGDRVIVEVKNHIATVTGNTTSPAIGTKTADGLRSSITQTAAEIRSEVVDEVNNLQSSITQHSDSITSLVKNQTDFSEFKQTVEGFSFMGKGGKVKISGGDITLTGAIKFSDLSDSSTVQSQINAAQSTANSASNAASTAYSYANSAITTVSGWAITSGSTTYIDGSMIYSNSIYADSVHLGGCLAVYRSMYSNTVGGYLGYDSGFNSASGIGIRNSTSLTQMVCSDSAARLSCGNPNSGGSYSQFVASGSSATIEASGSIFMELANVAVAVVSNHTTYYSLRPNTNNTVCLGTSANPWTTVYAGTCTGTTSDSNKKHSIEDLPEKYITIFDNLKPKRFKMNNGTSDRYHVGYIAQEVEESMNAAGVDSQEFGGFIRDKDDEGNDVLMLRYGEFDAIYTAKIKQLERRIIELENQLILK